MHCFLPLLRRGSDRGQGKDAQKGEAEKEIRKRVDGRGKSSLLGVLAWTQYKLTRLSDHRQKGELQEPLPSSWEGGAGKFQHLCSRPRTYTTHSSVSRSQLSYSLASTAGSESLEPSV